MIKILGPPQFTVLPQRRVSSELDGSPKFTFKVVGNPKPKITWYHDGTIVDASADYIDLGEDYLIVMDIIQADRGMYQARASNAVGDAQVSSELLIIPTKGK